jgi:hypothetical protein
VGDLDELQRGLLAQVDLPLQEGLEGAVALGEVELLLLDLEEHLTDLEEAALQPLAQGADLLGLVVQLADLRLDLVGARRDADGRPRAPRGSRLGRPGPRLGRMLGRVPRCPGGGAAQAELALLAVSKTARPSPRACSTGGTTRCSWGAATGRSPWW